MTGKISLGGMTNVTGAFLRGYCANLVFAVADNETLMEYAEALNSRDLAVRVEHEHVITGSFTSEGDKRILFTIPWDEGWTCRIDGQEVPIDKTWDLFMSVEAPQGHHEFELRFFPAWMGAGLAVGAAALLALIVFSILWRKRPDGRTGEETAESAESIAAAAEEAELQPEILPEPQPEPQRTEKET